MENKLVNLIVEEQKELQKEVFGLMRKLLPFMIVSSAITATIGTVAEAALEYNPETILKYAKFVDIIKNYLIH